MENQPTLLLPPGARFIALGAAGAVFENGNGIVTKIPIANDLKGCDEATIKHIRHIEYISDQCIAREKLIYQTLPKNPNILDCLEITDKGLSFPYHQFGDLRTYLSDHQASQHIRERWINNAIDAIAFIHSHGVVHADIGPRNFLVADDLSLKLCDFAGSIIIGDNMEHYVEEEDRYRLTPGSPRSFKTDLFALGCLIYEISGGVRPYDDIDAKEVARLYAGRSFPNLNGFRYHELIYKSWNSAYTTTSQLREDFLRQKESNAKWIPVSRPFGRPFMMSILYTICFGSVVFLAFQKRNFK